MNGIVIVDKPAGWTSQDVVSKLRGVLHTKRIGHGGTLDPMATGVLPVFVGRATRAVEFFEHAFKTYETVLRLGVTTDTEDITGTVLTEQDAFVTGQQLEKVLENFRGEIMQIPPMYSALKINGQKLVDLARKGREVERKPRPVTIHELTLLGMEADGIHLRVRCSKGTYIRTLCKDIGEALGCGGCMASLRRVEAGDYTIDEAVPLAELVEAADPGKYLRNVDTMFMNYRAIILTPNQEKRCRCGNSFTIDAPGGFCRVYSQTGEFLAVAHIHEGTLKTVKSFFEVE